MPYLVNPKGRIVAIDDELEYATWLKKAGFRPATPEEAKAHQDEIKATIKAQEMEANSDQMKKGVYLATVSQGGQDGYGIASAKMLKELQKLEVPISLHNEGQKIALLFHNPYSISKLDNDYRILYTMFESDKIPDDWKEHLEKAEMVIVPSHWCKSVFEKAGITARVVPLGYDDKVFKFVQRKTARETRRDFVFLHYNAFNVRKGFQEVWAAFNKAFEKNEPVKLILKTTLERIPLPITRSEYPNVEIISGRMSDRELAQLNGRADCFLFPSRGEGFGMTPLEAMATGATAIVPNEHGISEYFNSEYMYEVKATERCPAIYSKYKNQDVGKMVVADVDDLAQQMRYVYEHQDENLEMGRKAAEYVKQWTYTNTANKLYEIFEEVLSNPLPERALHNKLEVEAV